MPEGNLTYKRGEIRWVNLDPTVGAEAQKIHLLEMLKDAVQGWLEVASQQEEIE